MLAKDGTRFAACITPNVVCQPSRASILTGLLPMTHGVSDNGIDLPPHTGERGFAGTLSRADYRTGFVGKAHFSSFFTFSETGTPECRASSSRYGPEWYGPYMGFDYVELVLGGHNNWLPQAPPFGAHYEAWYYRDGRGGLKNRLYETHLPPDVGAAQTFHSALPPAWHNSTWVGDRTIEFLRANQTVPFCLWASFPDPHHPFDAPDPWGRLHHPDDVDLPQHRTLDLERRPWWHEASLSGRPAMASAELRGLRETYSRIPPQSDLQLRHLIANYYGMISLIDHNVGRILVTLDELNLSRNTLVIFTSDHGDWLGDHGLILKGPMMYDGLLRVGLIVRGPEIRKNHVIRDPVSTLDIAASILDYCGVAAEAPLHSATLRPLLENDETREFALNEWDLTAARCGVALDLRTVRTKRHRLTVERKSGAAELYDLFDDPHEVTNRSEDPDFRAIRRELELMIASRPADEISRGLAQVGMA